MSEIELTDDQANALHGTTDAETGFRYHSPGDAGYFTEGQRQWQRDDRRGQSAEQVAAQVGRAEPVEGKAFQDNRSEKDGSLCGAAAEAGKAPRRPDSSGRRACRARPHVV